MLESPHSHRTDDFSPSTYALSRAERLVAEISGLCVAAPDDVDGGIYEKLIAKLGELELCVKRSARTLAHWSGSGKLHDSDLIAEHRLQSRVSTVAFLPDSDRIVCGTSNGELRVLTLAAGKLTCERSVLDLERMAKIGLGALVGSGIESLAVNDEGTLVAVGRRGGNVELYSVSSNDHHSTPGPIARFDFGGRIRSLAFKPEGAQLLVGGERKQLAILELSDITTALEDGSPVRLAPVFTLPTPRTVWGVGVASDGMMLGYVLEGGATVLHTSSPVSSPNAGKFFAAYQSGIPSFHSNSGEAWWHLQEGGCVSFCPGGDLVATGTFYRVEIRDLRFINPTTKTPLLVGVLNMDQGLSAISFSPDGSQLLVASGDTIEVRAIAPSVEMVCSRTKDLPLIASYDAGSRITSAAFSAEGSRIVAGTDSGRVLVL